MSNEIDAQVQSLIQTLDYYRSDQPGRNQMYYMQNSVDSTDNSCQHKAGITKLLQLFRISDTAINLGIAGR